MIKKGYLVLFAAVLLSFSAVASADQKEKTEGQQKEKPADEAVTFDAFPFAIQIGGGSYLGVYLEDVTAERAKSLNLREERGAVVMKVAEDSPAQKAGLKENDVIVSFNGRPIESVRELQRVLSETPEGRTVQLEVIRDGNRQKLSATLSNRFNLSRPFDQRKFRVVPRLSQRFPDFGTFDFKGSVGVYRTSNLGISVETMSDQLAEHFGVKDAKGLLVTEVRENSPAAKAGLKAGDVITAVDNEKGDNLISRLSAAGRKDGGQVSLTIVRDRAEQAITVTLEKREPKPVPRRQSFITTM
ncbi:MAG TPA: PDZ domain-containing protein [Blastocatellia bacterium]|jgi:S1-C subfamily serine protease